jgi:DNA modification methylase
MTVTFIAGDCRVELRKLPDARVHCCVTSPPFFGLRSYLPDSHPDKYLEIGLEDTPTAYVKTLVKVFRKVRRVLRKDGTLWLSLGDTEAGSKQRGFKPKDLMMMPARVAIALQEDGWDLRSEVIWVKPNPMVESCTDRPTSAHEKIFLFAKSTNYRYDADAVMEPATSAAPNSLGFLARKDFEDRADEGHGITVD